MARTKANVPSAYSSFLEWNEDPEIASAAEKLYGSIDKLELYVGLQAEQAKPVIPGAGLCPGKHTLHNAAFLLLADMFRREWCRFERTRRVTLVTDMTHIMLWWTAWGQQTALVLCSLLR